MPVVKTPLHQSRSNPLSPNINDGRGGEFFNNGGGGDKKNNQADRRRDRSSKHIRGGDKEDHNRLSKRISVQSTSSWNSGKDQEDGSLVGAMSTPTAGSIHSLMFGSTYTRKHGALSTCFFLFSYKKSFSNGIKTSKNWLTPLADKLF